MDRLFGSTTSRTQETRSRSLKRRSRLRTRPSFEFLEARIVQTVDVWTGASSNLWSVAGNWTLGTPTAGEALDFPAGVSQLATSNDLSGMSFQSIEIDGAGYGFSGNAITVTNGISSTYTTGSSQFAIDTTFTATETVDVAGGGTLDFAGTISGSGFGLNKTGGGTLDLSTSSSEAYTGTTTVSAGELDMNGGGGMGLLAGPLVIDGSAGSALVKDLASDQISNQPVTLMGAGATWNLNNFSDNVGLLTFTGGTVETGTGQLNPQNSVVTNAASTTATISGNFDIHAVNPVILNIAQGTVPNGGPDLNLSAVIWGGGFTRSLWKGGAGILGLSGASTYNGGTTINAGVIAISNGSALGTGLVTIANGAELDLSGGITLSDNIAFSGSGVGGNGAIQSVSGDNVYSGTATIQANGSVIQVDAGQLTLSGNLTDNSSGYSTDKTGAGLLIITGNLTSSGSLVSQAGGVQVDGTYNSTITVDNGNVSGTGTIGSINQVGGATGTINPGTGGNSIGALTTLGGYAVITGATTQIDIGGTTPGVGYDQIVNSTSGGINLTGSSVNPTLVGGFVPAIGDSFEIINNQSSGAVIGTFNNLPEGATFKSGIVTYQVSYTGGNGNDVTLTVVGITYTWTGLGGNSNWSTPSNWDTNQAPTGGEDLVFPSGAAQLANINDITGLSVNSIEIDGAGYGISGNPVTVTYGFLSTFGSGASQFAIDTTLTATETVNVAGGGLFDFTGSISGSSFGLTKTGAGVLQLDGANTYTGVTTVSAGILAISNSGSLGTGAVADNAEIEIINNLLLNNNFTINSAGTAFLVDGLTTIQGTVSLSSNLVIDTPGFANLYLNGVVSGSGFGISKNGTGTLGLGQADTYTAGTSINGGSLQVFNGQATGTTGTLAVNAGATFVLSTATYTLPSGGLSLGDSSTFLVPLSNAETLNGSITLTGNTTFSIATSGVLTVSGAIGGSFGLTKTNGGALILEAAGTYTGPTTITAGELLVNGDLTSSPTIDVQSGAVLGGSGRLAQVQVNPGGTFSPGASPVTITAASLAMSSGASFVEQLFGNTPGNGTTGYDQTIVTSGPVNLNNATLNLSLGGGYVPTVGDVLTIIDNQSNVPITGAFNGLADGSLVDLGGSILRLNYAGGDGNDVTLTDISSTVTTVSLNPNAGVYGQSVSMTAVVGVNPPGSGTPTGSVRFLDGTTVLGVAALTPVMGRQTAVFTTSALAVGAHSITAQYVGDQSFAASSTQSVSLVVAKADDSTTLTGGGTTELGQRATFIATVSATAPGAGTPTGLVTFLDGSTPIGAALLNGGTATYSTSSFDAGIYAISAIYTSGDAEFNPGTPSSPVTEVVSPSASSMVLSSSAQLSTYGQPVTLSAFVVAANPKAGLPTGFVAFLADGVLLGSAPVELGVAKFTLDNLNPGNSQITAVYSGDGSVVASQAVLTQVVSPAPTTASIWVQTEGKRWHWFSRLDIKVDAQPPGAIPPSGTALIYMNGRHLRGVRIVNGSFTASVPNSYRRNLFGVVFRSNPYFAASSSRRVGQISHPSESGNILPNHGHLNRLRGWIETQFLAKESRASTQPTAQLEGSSSWIARWRRQESRGTR